MGNEIEKQAGGKVRKPLNLADLTKISKRKPINIEALIERPKSKKELPKLKMLRNKISVFAPQGYKQCTKCGEVKPLENGFSKQKQNPSGYHSHCKDCIRKYQQANAGMKVIIEHRRRARKANLLDDFTPQDWQYALGYFNGCCAVCGRQMNDMFGEFYPAQDHWLPLSKGGHNIPENIVPLCHGKGGCNNKKKDTLPESFLEREYGKRKAKEILAKIDTFFTTVRIRES